MQCQVCLYLYNADYHYNHLTRYYHNKC